MAEEKEEKMINTFGHTVTDALKHEPAGLHTLPCTNCILLLEDFDAIRAFLARHYEREGFTVYSASTPQDAKIIARTINPLIAIVDSSLSNANSLDALRDLRQILPHSIIILSGGVESATLQETAKVCGASEVLSHGYDLSRLDRMISLAKLP
jgi:DNA-binding response OmpR family regulator